MAQPKIFVSHSHQDNAYCREFVAALRQKLESNDAVWYDEHNLGWGKLRREIEQELAQRQHFIAILSPAAVKSDWVNDEIDAAIELRRRSSMQTIQFVIALQCEMPLLLSNYRRQVAPDGQPYSPKEAAVRTLAVIQPISPNITPVTPQPTAPQVEQPSILSTPTPTSQPSYMALNEQLFQQHTEYVRQEQAMIPQTAPITPEHFPQRLADLGFVGKTAIVDGKSVEYIVPPLCDVPAGPFLMGEKKYRVTLPFYRIARYPVTVAEYACFVRAGYAQPTPPNLVQPSITWEQQLAKFDHPVVCVDWMGAVNYAAWLSECTGQPWRLPTEAEWEKAARGTDGCIYPWGNTMDKTCCNTSESSINDTTPIGTYPSGAGPYGTQDQAGNVWEWTITDFYNLRGGSWASGDARAASLNLFGPAYANDFDFGFRLVVAAHPAV